MKSCKAFILNSNNTLNDIILLPTSSTVAGDAISATNAAPININGSQIASSSNRFTETGLFLSASQLNLNNNSIFTGFTGRRGIRAELNSSLRVELSAVDVTRTTMEE